MRFLFLISLLLLWIQPAPAPSIVERNFQKHFSQYGLQGSFLLYDEQAARFTAYDLKRCRQGFLPASTFKIPNTIIGLETGVIQDTSQIMKWDGQKRSFPQWNQDMTLAQALRVSCVPCYQQIARGVGAKRYNEKLSNLRFGAMRVTEATVDSFWLTGSSRITQFQQIDFLRRLYANQLPATREHQQTTKALLELRRTAGYRLYGKTGWTGRAVGLAAPIDNGWFVGWLERTDGRTFYFALNAEPQPGRTVADTKFIPGRRAITEDILAELQLLSPQ
ncbi:class D beta-lactamase [Hymenobacter sp. YC55]|uniref:class D beta-lactamase n=1 Tax=Hymenobacter sp. YC55 TaxID=3034019 RepID=UPI0023F93CEA|nr:class D beta-lactamase [Hymenobacter sp. YC55]MDF7813674.1 class D beta-lactamase [Hymenobacter sp. YC55]